jgi:hypothetical protein
MSEAELRKASCELAAKTRASLIPATILDQESRPLATGGLRPDTDGGLLFLLYGRANAGIPLAEAASVQYPDGRTARLFDFHRCPSELSVHYHFQIQK